MSALNRKLLRDLTRLWGQVLAIGLVIAAGVATVVMALGTLHSLGETRTAYYERYGLGHVFAQAKRAPEFLADRIAEIPGVAQVSTRISEHVILDMPGMDEPARANIVSLPEGRQPELNRVVIRTGRMIRRGHPDEALIGEAFAEAHELMPGDTVTANINGRQRTLTVVGIALAPEFIYVIGPGDLVPDGRRYGIIWMGREALEAAFDLEGAFNDVAISLTREGTEAAVIEAGRQSAGTLRRRRRLWPQGPSVGQFRAERDGPAGQPRLDHAADLHGGRRLPAERGDRPADRDRARADRAAEGVRLRQCRGRLALYEVRPWRSAWSGSSSAGVSAPGWGAA